MLQWADNENIEEQALIFLLILNDIKKTLGESAPACTTVKKKYAEFRRGRSSCEDSQCYEWPHTFVDEETAEQINKLVINYRQLSVDFIAEHVGISTGTSVDFDTRIS